jgi:hypothetical protein
MPNRPLNTLLIHMSSQYQCLKPHVLLFRTSCYGGRQRCADYTTAIKHLETARRKPRALVHRDPMSAYILQHVRNCKLNLAAIIRGFLSCRPGDCLRVISWRAEKASSCALSAASETPGTNPKAEVHQSHGDARKAFLTA